VPLTGLSHISALCCRARRRSEIRGAGDALLRGALVGPLPTAAPPNRGYGDRGLRLDRRDFGHAATCPALDVDKSATPGGRWTPATGTGGTRRWTGSNIRDADVCWLWPCAGEDRNRRGTPSLCSRNGLGRPAGLPSCGVERALRREGDRLVSRPTAGGRQSCVVPRHGCVPCRLSRCARPPAR